LRRAGSRGTRWTKGLTTCCGDESARPRRSRAGPTSPSARRLCRSARSTPGLQSSGLKICSSSPSIDTICESTPTSAALASSGRVRALRTSSSTFSRSTSSRGRTSRPAPTAASCSVFPATASRTRSWRPTRRASIQRRPRPLIPMLLTSSTRKVTPTPQRSRRFLRSWQAAHVSSSRFPTSNCRCGSHSRASSRQSASSS
jgi:hypothetical protein